MTKGITFAKMITGKKKGFSLLELTATVAVIAILAVLAFPAVKNLISNTSHTRLIHDAKLLEEASLRYFIEHDEWPKLGGQNATPLTKDEILSDEDMLISNDGTEVTTKEEEFWQKVDEGEIKLYSLDMEALSQYVRIRSNASRFVLRNPLGAIYIITNTTGQSGPIVAENIVLNEDAVTLDIDQTFQLIATVLPEDAEDKTVTWISDDEAIATISETGLVTAINNGTSVITATTSNGLTATATVTVNNFDAIAFTEAYVSSLNTHTLLIAPEEDNRLYAIGSNTYGQIGDGTTNYGDYVPVDTELRGFVAVAAGSTHSTALHESKNVYQWGDGTYIGHDGYTTGSDALAPVQISLNSEGEAFTNIKAIDAALAYTIALREDGTVWTWGTNQDGVLGYEGAFQKLPKQVPGLSNIVKISAGQLHMLAVDENGNVWAWGNNSAGRLGDGGTTSRSTPQKVVGLGGVGELADIIDIAAGNSTAYALDSSGRVWAWGSGSNGRLGNGANDSSLTPVLSNMTDAVAIKSGVNALSAIALKDDGTVWAWGHGLSGGLGNGSTTAQSNPVQVTGLTDIVQIDASYRAGLAQKANGETWAWGNNSNERFSLFQPLDNLIPFKLARLNVAMKSTFASGGLSHTLVILPDKTVMASGSNSHGQLGINSTTAQNELTQVAGLTNVASVAAGRVNHSTALREDGTVWQWGRAITMGFDTGGANQLVPVRVQLDAFGNAFNNIVDIGSGSSITVALKNNGTVWVWGSDVDFLGLGENLGIERIIAPARVSLPPIVDIAVGPNYALALASDGTVWAWGANTSGQIGNGSTIQAFLPVQVPGLSNIVGVAVNSATSYALASNGTYWAWGTNTFGEFGNGTNTSSNVPVHVTTLNGAIEFASGTSNHMVALKSNGEAHAWGYNNFGSIGDGTTENKNVPTKVANSSYIAVGKGNNTGFGKTSDGKIYAWGLNASGQLGDGSLTTRFTPVQVYPVPEPVTMSSGVFASGGISHSLVILPDKTVMAAGSNVNGQLGINSTADQNKLTQVPGLTNVASVAAGYLAHSTALRGDGTVWQWGEGQYMGFGSGATPQLVPARVLTDINTNPFNSITAIGAGDTFTVAVKSDGTVWSWGIDSTQTGVLGYDNGAARVAAPRQVSGLPSIARISVGEKHTLALADNGTVWAWGNNLNGKIGNNSTTHVFTPVQVSGLSNIVDVATGNSTSYALAIDGTYYAWGNGATGRFGNDGTASSLVPVQVTTLNDAVTFANTSSPHILALTSNGETYGWGINSQGGIGDGTTAHKFVPTRVTDSNFVAIGGGSQTGFGKTADGRIFAWGGNANGRLGDGTNDNQLIPVLVYPQHTPEPPPELPAAQISAAYHHSMVLLENRDVYSFGTGRTGHGDTDGRLIPTKIETLSNAKQVAAGTWHSLILLENGDVYSFGWNKYGQLGDGTLTDRLAPTKIETLSNAKQVAVGHEHSLVLLENGDVYSFGYGFGGRLGHNNQSDSSVPMKIETLSNVKQIAAGSEHSLVLLENGDVYSFGVASYGRLGHSTTNQYVPKKIESLSNVKQISATNVHNIVLLENGDAYSFGFGGGRLGQGDLEHRLVPTKIESLSNVKQVSAGSLHSLVLLENGDVYSFGSGTAGQLGHGDTNEKLVPAKITALSNVKQVSAGVHSLVLLETGAVYSFGTGGYGALGHGDTSNKYLPTKITSF